MRSIGRPHARRNSSCSAAATLRSDRNRWRIGHQCRAGRTAGDQSPSGDRAGFPVRRSDDYPGNAVSKFIDDKIIKAGEESQSDATKDAKQKFRDGVESADGVGDELKAVGGYVVENPLLSAAQAAAAAAPTAPAGIVPDAVATGANEMAAARLGELQQQEAVSPLCRKSRPRMALRC